ncbi:uncharacterized protein YqgQ [Bacillus sp. SORGH_AS 510]|nr:uncharacterized protein YqgQ [Bacillus sp. SORGH_AS_0510]
MGYTFCCETNCSLHNKFKGIKMKNIYEIQQFLKQFGTFIYVGDRVADLELMESELKELYQAQFIEPRDYQTALLILRHEIQLQKEKSK